MLNRPSTMSLSGPGWRAEQWIHAASMLGIRVKAVRRSSVAPVTAEPDGSLETVTVVGGSALGKGSAQNLERTLELARRAGVQLMSAVFSGSTLVSATDWVNLEPDEVSTPVMEYLLE